jgi:hypothetical protein
MSLIKEELNSDNPKIRSIGAQRMAGAASYVAAKSAIIGYASHAAGTGMTGLIGYIMDDEEEKDKEKDLRRFVAPWSKNSDLIIVSAGNGKVKYIDFSASDPHGGLKKAMNSFFNEENPVDGFGSALVEAISPFIGEEMTTESLLALKNNEDKYGKPIYNPEDTYGDMFANVAKHVYGVVEPGTISSVRRGWEAEDKKTELTANLTGYRVYDVDVNEQFGFKTRDLSERIKNAKKIYNKAFYNKDSSKEKIEAEHKRAQEALNLIYQEAIDTYNSAERLGVDKKELRAAMSDFGNFSKRTIIKIERGELPELEVKPEIERPK